MALLVAVPSFPAIRSIASASSSGHASAGLATDSVLPSWDNGLIRLSFPGPLPSFSVTSDQDARVTSAHTLVRVVELRANGTVSASAPFVGPNVTSTLASAPYLGGSEIWLNASLPVAHAQGTWGLGDEVLEEGISTRVAQITLTFFVNSSAAPDADSVRFQVSMTQWPWANVTDLLGLEIATTAAPSTTLADGTTLTSLEELANTTGHVVATLSWSSLASVGYTGGSGTTSLVGSARTIDPTMVTSTVRLQFAAVPGGYSHLEYDPWVDLNPTAFRIAPLPALTLTEPALVVIAAAASIAGLLAVVAYRARSNPPRARGAAATSAPRR
ncbi:MAG: hypothetical protein L3J93_00740 [Thermoplasmata archaeon]|nr:hypothetical protein [Thermoplasmata archaeon]